MDDVYTDFSKAFDSVNHLALTYKLEWSGIKGDLLRWLDSYLRDRFQIVKLFQHLSKKYEVTSGVPQGSHLGPLLFTLFINDISWIIGNQVVVGIFADDLKIYRKITNYTDSLILQESLDMLSAYCQQFQLYINIDKCSFITFPRKLAQCFSTSYNFSDITLAKVHNIKNLGVILNSKLTYNSQIKHC
jgi:hypothetical protein